MLSKSRNISRPKSREEKGGGEGIGGKVDPSRGRKRANQGIRGKCQRYREGYLRQLKGEIKKPKHRGKKKGGGGFKLYHGEAQKRSEEIVSL